MPGEEILWVFPVNDLVGELCTTARVPVKPCHWTPTTTCSYYTFVGSLGACSIYPFGNDIMEHVVEIAFRSYRIEALCSSAKALRRKYGPDGARKIKLRLSQLEAVETLEAMRGIARCHELTHDKRGQLALDLHRGFRLIIEPAGDWQSKRDGGLDWRSVSETVVIAIEDYH